MIKGIPKNVDLHSEYKLMKPIRRAVAILLLTTLAYFPAQGQKVGLVLSGGGASAMSHVGVIKALEENDIPIDYITGTSMGALIGALYASGYTTDQMIAFAESKNFQLALTGDLPEADQYYFTQELVDASVIRLKIYKEKILQKSLPTNVVTPNYMEYLLIDKFGPPGAASNNNFDSLMVPFRCVAANIVSKEQVIFKNGNLPVALRASSTYPFYFKPITVDGNLLFDGGLYNNFPVDIMENEFNPDFVIGSNVAAAVEAPDEDDLFSQVRAMITSKSNYDWNKEKSLIIEPESNIGVFDFSDVQFEIALGYYATIARMDEIKSKVERRINQAERNQKREAFQSKFPNSHVDEVRLLGNLNAKQKEYLYSTLGSGKKDSVYTLQDFKSQFLRLSQDEKIKYVQPIANFDSTRGYVIDLHVKREKDFTVYFGGNFSSRPVNMGYVGLKYNLFGRTSTSFFANSYFGKFYGSFLVQAKVDFGGQKRFSITPHIIFNRWDYFENFATFFELSKPSYIVKNERYGGLEIATPWGNNTVIKAGFDYGLTQDEYYQTVNFTAQDTTDVTDFELITASIGVDRNTLNRKQYASSGTRLQLSFRGVNGHERTSYGTTSDNSEVFKDRHYWVEAKASYENYFGHWGNYTLGFQAEGLYSTKPFYENYTASLISSPAYQPIPESKTIFIDEFRTTQYLAGGLRNIFEIKNNLELRLEGYVFAPGKAIVQDPGSNDAKFSTSFVQAYYIGSSALIFHSPLGPISLNLNYFDQQEEPWSFYFNFGFTIFNKSVYEP